MYAVMPGDVVVHRGLQEANDIQAMVLNNNKTVTQMKLLLCKCLGTGKAHNPLYCTVLFQHFAFSSALGPTTCQCALFTNPAELK